MRERSCTASDGICAPSTCEQATERVCVGDTTCAGCIGRPCYMGTCTEVEQSNAPATFSCDCVDGWSGVTCDTFMGCDGIMANRAPVCAAADIPSGGACAGAAFLDGSTADSGSCAAAESGTELQCFKQPGGETARCMTAAQWEEQNVSALGVPLPAEVLQCAESAEAAAEAYGACCGLGALPMPVGVQDTECCPWRIGASIEDGRPECCRDVDVCNTCGGAATSIDADGAAFVLRVQRPHPADTRVSILAPALQASALQATAFFNAGNCCATELDAERSCCDGVVDACGICNGDGSACRGAVALTAFIVPPPDFTPCTAADLASDDLTEWCAAMRSDFCRALRFSILPGLEEAEAAGEDVSALVASVDCTALWIDPATGEPLARRRLLQTGIGGFEEFVFELSGAQRLFDESTVVRLATTDTPRVPPPCMHCTCSQEIEGTGTPCGRRGVHHTWRTCLLALRLNPRSATLLARATDRSRGVQRGTQQTSPTQRRGRRCPSVTTTSARSTSLTSAAMRLPAA